MKRNNGVDLFRLIGAFFVMFLHAPYTGLDLDYVDNVRIMARWVVPFFFMVSGFFLGNKIDELENLNFSKIQNNIKQLFTIFIVSSALYLPVGQLNGRGIFGLDTLLLGTYYHLWFIGSLVFSYIFIWYIHFIKKSKFLPYISLVILILALLTDSYDQFLGKAYDFDLFQYLMSIPFVYLGLYIFRKREKLGPSYVYVLVMISGIVIQFGEVYMFEKIFNSRSYSYQLLIGTLLMVVPMFVLSTKIKIPENFMSLWGQRHSLFIYLYHPLLYAIFSIILAQFMPDIPAWLNALYPAVGFLLTLITAIFLRHYLLSVYKLLKGDLGN